MVGCRRLGGEVDRWATEDSQGGGTAPCDTALVDSRHNALSNPMDCTMQRMDPTVNYGLWLTAACQYCFVDYNVYPTNARY